MGFLDFLHTIFDEGAPNYNESWLRHASDKELDEEREKVRLRLCSGEDVYGILDRFDEEISRRAWGNEEYKYPSHTQHGWYLSDDD